jgi:hypothetical protein
VFRRGNAGARGDSAQDDQGEQSLGAPQTTKVRPAAETAKGHATPKRSEAERGRRQGITGTPSRSGSASRSGSGTKTSSADARADRLARNEAMRRGEEWALPARDRGPVKALARDYIDSRRRLSEYYMYLMIVLVVVLFIKKSSVQLYAEPIALVLILLVVVDAAWLRFKLTKLVRERLPGKNTRGLTMYAVFRALQIRRFRVPPPRIRPGDKF